MLLTHKTWPCHFVSAIVALMSVSLQLDELFQVNCWMDVCNLTDEINNTDGSLFAKKIDLHSRSL